MEQIIKNSLFLYKFQINSDQDVGQSIIELKITTIRALNLNFLKNRSNDVTWEFDFKEMETLFIS